MGPWGFWSGWTLVAVGVAWSSRAAPTLAVGAVLLSGIGWIVALACSDRAGCRWPIVLAAALGLRVAPWIAGPELSDDIQRYVWEGAVTDQGANPYALAPDAPQLSELRQQYPQLHARVAHREIPAAYPPLAQGLHALVVALSPGSGEARARRAEFGLRAAYLACDLAVVVLLALLLRQRGLPEARCVAWAWSPLCATEFAGAGHLDSLAIALLLAAWVATRDPLARGRTLAGSLLIAAAVLVKYLPVVALPGFLRGRRGWLAGLVAACGVCALAWAPFLGSGSPWHGLSEYAERWNGSNLAFRLVERAVAALLPHEHDPRVVTHAARVACGVLWLAIVAWASWRASDRVSGARIAIAAFLVLAPVVHPWYVTWMAPFVALRRDAEWVWMLAVVPLWYAPLHGWRHDGIWIEPQWAWPLVALPFAALLALRVVRDWRSARSRA